MIPPRLSTFSIPARASTAPISSLEPFATPAPRSARRQRRRARAAPDGLSLAGVRLPVLTGREEAGPLPAED